MSQHQWNFGLRDRKLERFFGAASLNIMALSITTLGITMENVRQVVARVVLSVFMRKYFIFRVSFFKPSIKIVSAGKY
jgi:hypothetical protein